MNSCLLMILLMVTLHGSAHQQQDTSRPAKGERGTEKEKGEENQQ
jgi:hypothetical protein